jgi:hypothetical protein
MFRLLLPLYYALTYDESTAALTDISDAAAIFFHDIHQIKENIQLVDL